ncbi:efflux RND transporter periplasmic adaptor subunit [Agrobacterium pusense]|jgi:HlyD family secretion protein|uniref:efflux RND transporter periplasmic adaptor subunit n=1 Tax=Agrobacterium pusense TaxID=648995 RepID=UPI0037C14081
MQHKVTFNRILFLLLLSATALPLPAAAEGEAQAPVKQQNVPSIIVAHVTKRDLVDRVIATGTIRPVDEIYVQPLVDGLSIDTLNVDIGDKVEANAVLAVLSSDSLILQKSQLEANKAKAQAAVAQAKAQVLEAEASANDANRQRDRAAKLGQSGSGSVSQVEQTQAQAEVAAAKLNAARQAVSAGEADIKVVDAQIADIDLKLTRTGVKTPVAGIVSAKNAKVGAIASGAGNPLFTVIKDGAIELVADLSETDIQNVKVGQKAYLTVAGGRAKIEGKVRLVSPTVDPTTRLGSVHVVLPENSPARSGMYASAEIVIEETNALALPLSAVTSGREGSTTRKVEGDVVKQVKIETGIEDGGFIEIVSGLAAGDKVVEKAGAFVRDGDRIRPVEAQTAASN